MPPVHHNPKPVYAKPEAIVLARRLTLPMGISGEFLALVAAFLILMMG